MRLLHDQSGLAYAAAVAFGTIIVIAISWSVLGPTLEQKIFQYAENEAENGNYDYAPTANLIHFAWGIWPLILLLAVIIYLLMASQRRVHETGVYGG